ncbi:hypothetical protein YK56LOC_42520 [Caballeronia sp. HLA56]
MIAVSHYVRQHLISAGVPNTRVHTIYDGIHKWHSKSHSTLRTELGIEANATVACMVAMMRDEKGHEDLIEAVRPLAKPHMLLHVVLAGDGPEFARIKNLVHRLGLETRIHMLGFRKDVPNILNGSDMFVLPTHREALGQAFIEAMAAGVPVIGTRVGGVPELIQDGVNGLLVPPRDPSALREAIGRMANDAGLRVRLGEEGRRITERGFTVSDMAYETSLYYRSSLYERGFCR